MSEKSKELTAEDESYYDENYFVKGNKQITDANTGETKVWGYQGTDWAGNFAIVEGLLKVFKGEIGRLVDIGAGQGSFTDYAIRSGLNCMGYDFAQWAVDNALHCAKGNLFQSSATSVPEKDASADLIFCSDMVEHIKQSEIPQVVAEFYRITKKWVFLQFPVCKEDEVFNFEKDDKSHPLYSHYMIAGHLNMATREWWDNLFKEHGFKLRDDLVGEFRKVMPPAVITNWNNIIILEK